MNQRRIVIDGKAYNSVEEMPAEIRKRYEEIMRRVDKDQDGMPDRPINQDMFADNNKNGVPDVFEDMNSLQGVISNVMSSTKFVANGQTYDSLDQLPPEIRAKYEKVMDKLDANHDGVPDLFEGTIKRAAETNKNASVDFGTPASTPSQPFNDVQNNPIPASPTIEPESTPRWLIALAIVTVIGMCLLAAGAAWYFFLR